MGAGSSQVAKENRQIVQQTGFTVEQVHAWRKLFMEVCPNGKLLRSNFVELYKKMFPEGTSMMFYHHMFRVYDTDRSGSLEFPEFIQVLSITERGTAEQILDLAFRLYDIDGNGTIEMRELAEILRALYSYRRGSRSSDVYLSQVVEIMRKLDTDRDGVLSREEFVRGCMNDPEIARLLVGGIKPRHSLI